MKKILLVNSVITFHERNKSLLNRADLKLLTAVSGREALRVHRQERADLIIADLDMPQIGGDNLCSIIRTDKEFKNTPILLTCRNTPEELERIAQSGASAWITKPIDPGVFLEKVGQLLTVSVRKDYRVLLKAKVKGEIGSTPFFCTSYNISISGILIETDKVLNKGDRITCTFFLPGSRQIVVDGETIRSLTMAENCFHYGIRFVDLDREARAEIEKFIGSFA